MRIGLFGGTFNPIHLGHLRAAEEARERIFLEKVIFIPTGTPPLKSHRIIESAERLRLVKVAVAENPYFEVSDIEINQPGKSYTVETVHKMKKLYSAHELFFIVGIDAFMDMPLWYKPESILSAIDFIVLTRPGYPPGLLKSSSYIADDSIKDIECISDDIENAITLKLKGGRSIIILNITGINISSSMIRERIETGRSLRYLVPDTTLKDISSLKF